MARTRRHPLYRSERIGVYGAAFVAFAGFIVLDCGGSPEAKARSATVAQDVPAAAANAPAPTEELLATPAELERVLRLGGHRSVAESAATLLASARAGALAADERWRVRRAQLIALAWLGQREPLDEAWAAAAQVHDADQLAALAGQIYSALLAEAPGDGSLLADLHARGEAERESFLAGAMQPRDKLTDAEAWRTVRVEAARRLALPTGHPEGFPRAWLAPDERPEGP
jgi:hypothetical protein